MQNQAQKALIAMNTLSEFSEYMKKKEPGKLKSFRKEFQDGNIIFYLDFHDGRTTSFIIGINNKVVISTMSEIVVEARKKKEMQAFINKVNALRGNAFLALDDGNEKETGTSNILNSRILKATTDINGSELFSAADDTETDLDSLKDAFLSVLNGAEPKQAAMDWYSPADEDYLFADQLIKAVVDNNKKNKKKANSQIGDTSVDEVRRVLIKINFE